MVVVAAAGGERLISPPQTFVNSTSTLHGRWLRGKRSESEEKREKRRRDIWGGKGGRERGVAAHFAGIGRWWASFGWRKLGGGGGGGSVEDCLRYPLPRSPWPL